MAGISLRADDTAGLRSRRILWSLAQVVEMMGY
jgi:hypothetical protein